jgi:hypothetical protein
MKEFQLNPCGGMFRGDWRNATPPVDDVNREVSLCLEPGEAAASSVAPVPLVHSPGLTVPTWLPYTLCALFNFGPLSAAQLELGSAQLQPEDAGDCPWISNIADFKPDN